ncbi:MAG: hypothetical protein NC037_06540 [Bacteroides sp.]|nr:hypothetical protein [Bacillota bacterium]MCM1393520.1 hypothetical protein [[Eubacterium] siraeum]MCM1456162.1 hypothetical protein [Bacteroides sp.]
MEIRDTGLWQEHTEFLTKPPENDYAAFSSEGFTYINQSIGLAIALHRSSKSNYDVTLITEDGCILVLTEHSISKAVNRVRVAIERARRNKQ